MKDTKKEHVKKVIITVFAVLIFVEAVAFAWYIYLVLTDEPENKYYVGYLNDIKKYEKLKDTYGVSKLTEINSDFIAWLNCEDIDLSMPIVKSSDYDNQNYYLTHNFEKKDSVFGCPYLKYGCETTSDNLTIVGHSSFWGGVVIFSEFYNYIQNENNDYDYKIKIETLTGRFEYEIFSAFDFDSKTDSAEGTFVYNTADLSADETFTEFVKICTTRNKLDQNITIERQDKFITIITCSKRNLNNRVIVVAKLVK